MPDLLVRSFAPLLLLLLGAGLRLDPVFRPSLPDPLAFSPLNSPSSSTRLPFLRLPNVAHDAPANARTVRMHHQHRQIMNHVKIA
jgi:hypothetical protein